MSPRPVFEKQEREQPRLTGEPSPAPPASTRDIRSAGNQAVQALRTPGLEAFGVDITVDETPVEQMSYDHVLNEMDAYLRWIKLQTQSAPKENAVHLRLQALRVRLSQLGPPKFAILDLGTGAVKFVGADEYRAAGQLLQNRLIFYATEITRDQKEVLDAYPYVEVGEMYQGVFESYKWAVEAFSRGDVVAAGRFARQVHDYINIEERAHKIFLTESAASYIGKRMALSFIGFFEGAADGLLGLIDQGANLVGVHAGLVEWNTKRYDEITAGLTGLDTSHMWERSHGRLVGKTAESLALAKGLGKQVQAGNPAAILLTATEVGGGIRSSVDMIRALREKKKGLLEIVSDPGVIASVAGNLAGAATLGSSVGGSLAELCKEVGLYAPSVQMSATVAQVAKIQADTTLSDDDRRTQLENAVSSFFVTAAMTGNLLEVPGEPPPGGAGGGAEPPPGGGGGGGGGEEEPGFGGSSSRTIPDFDTPTLQGEAAFAPTAPHEVVTAPGAGPATHPGMGVARPGTEVPDVPVPTAPSAGRATQPGMSVARPGSRTLRDVQSPTLQGEAAYGPTAEQEVVPAPRATSAGGTTQRGMAVASPDVGTAPTAPHDVGTAPTQPHDVGTSAVRTTRPGIAVAPEAGPGAPGPAAAQPEAATPTHWDDPVAAQNEYLRWQNRNYRLINQKDDVLGAWNALHPGDLNAPAAWIEQTPAGPQLVVDATRVSSMPEHALQGPLRQQPSSPVRVTQQSIPPQPRTPAAGPSARILEEEDIGTAPTQPHDIETAPTQPHDIETAPTQPHDIETAPTQPHDIETAPTQPHDIETAPTQPHDIETAPTQPHDIETAPTQPHDIETAPTQPHDIETAPTQPHDIETAPTRPQQIPAAPGATSPGIAVAPEATPAGSSARTTQPGVAVPSAEPVGPNDMGTAPTRPQPIPAAPGATSPGIAVAPEATPADATAGRTSPGVAVAREGPTAIEDPAAAAAEFRRQLAAAESGAGRGPYSRMTDFSYRQDWEAARGIKLPPTVRGRDLPPAFLDREGVIHVDSNRVDVGVPEPGEGVAAAGPNAPRAAQPGSPGGTPTQRGMGAVGPEEAEGGAAGPRPAEPAPGPPYPRARPYVPRDAHYVKVRVPEGEGRFRYYRTINVYPSSDPEQLAAWVIDEDEQAIAAWRSHDSRSADAFLRRQQLLPPPGASPDEARAAYQAIVDQARLQGQQIHITEETVRAAWASAGGNGAPPAAWVTKSGALHVNGRQILDARRIW